MAYSGGVPDWRDAAAYAELHRAERSAFAWEWLRRDPLYRAAAVVAERRASPGGAILRPDQRALAWGLHAFEDPGLAAWDAYPVWTAERYTGVLRAWSERSVRSADSFELGAISATTTLVIEAKSEHLLVSDTLRTLRIDVVGSSLRDGPVLLHYDLHGLARVAAPLLALRQLIALAGRGVFSPALHRADRRARRHVLLLRTGDALRSGAAQRAIAAELLGTRAAEQRWRVETPSLRSQAQRLVRNARQLAGGAFWSYLR